MFTWKAGSNRLQRPTVAQKGQTCETARLSAFDPVSLSNDFEKNLYKLPKTAINSILNCTQGNLIKACVLESCCNIKVVQLIITEAVSTISFLCLPQTTWRG